MILKSLFFYQLCAALAALTISSSTMQIQAQPVDGTGDSSKLPTTTQQLPAGYYVYMGTNSRKPTPQRFSVTKTGTIQWHDLAPVSTPQSANNGGNKNIESFTNGCAKWKPRPVTGMPEVYAQISTTFEEYRLRYKCILLNAAQPLNIKVDLLDANDFKLAEFHIFASNFQSIDGTNLIEARGETGLSPDKYSRLADYKVNPLSW